MEKNITPLAPIYTDFNSAYVIASYPYGSLRTQIKIWIESKKNHGQRVVTCTLNPKTGEWNKPHAGTYSSICVLYIDNSNGHVESDGHGIYSDGAKEFLEKYQEVLSDKQKNHLIMICAAEEARKRFDCNFYLNPREAYPKLNEILVEWNRPDLKVVLKPSFLNSAEVK